MQRLEALLAAGSLKVAGSALHLTILPSACLLQNLPQKVPTKRKKPGAFPSQSAYTFVGNIVHAATHACYLRHESQCLSLRLERPGQSV
jgi:hypothetical protein